MSSRGFEGWIKNLEICNEITEGKKNWRRAGSHLGWANSGAGFTIRRSAVESVKWSLLNGPDWWDTDRPEKLSARSVVGTSQLRERFASEQRAKFGSSQTMLLANRECDPSNGPLSEPC